MSDTYTDEDVRAAVKATRRVKGGTIVGLLVEHEVRMALDAVAPAIAERAWDEGHRHSQRRGPDGCLCGAYYAGECGCGEYGTGPLISLEDNPYREAGR